MSPKLPEEECNVITPSQYDIIVQTSNTFFKTAAEYATGISKQSISVLHWVILGGFLSYGFRISKDMERYPGRVTEINIAFSSHLHQIAL